MKGKKLKDKKKKTLVVFYSRGGNTRKAGQEIAGILNADICEIESSGYKGIFGYLRAGYQAFKNKKPVIKFDKNPDDYDLIVLGTPNWGSKMASPARTFVYGREFKKIAYFCLQGGSGGEKILNELENLCGKAIARMIINEREIKDGSYSVKINEFCGKLKQKRE